MSFSMGQLQSGNMGAVGDQIKAGVNTVYHQVELAMTKNDQAALAGLLSNPLLPATAKSMLRSRLADPRRSPEATQEALTEVKAALDAEAADMTAGLTSALKTAFTAAVHRVYFLGLFILAAGFVVTLFLPELALRKTAGHAAPASAEG